MHYAFGPFRLDRSAYQAYRGDRSLELTPKLLDLLFYLVERPATLVTKEELLDNVWPGANVTENALAQAISELREALDDSATSPTYIRTVARRGYRFIAPVTGLEAPAAAPAAPAAATDGSRTIAVLDFLNVTGDADVAWLAAGIAETVTSDLAALDYFRVIDRWRVVQVARRSGGSMHEMAAALGAGLVVTGSYQRRGTRLRITARVLDLQSGDAVADAKVDGQLDDVFLLQDGIVRALAREMSVPGAPPAGRSGVGETSSLEAYRAHTEGWLKIESLDTDLVRASIADFERAIRLDPGYAMAYTGLANAQFVAYEMTRATSQPDVTSLTSGVGHARRAIRLDPRLAEAHATLSFLLSSAMSFAEARTEAQRAVSLEPESWRHHYRLGHAEWGHARLRALDRALAIYPDFGYASFEAAMVHVARGDLEVAERLGRDGVTGQDRQAHSSNRFPAIGFHWLCGAIAAADGRADAAIEHFNREIEQVDRRRLYGPEYGAVSLVARGHVELDSGRPEHALASFRAALAEVPGYARAQLGEAAALDRIGDAAASGGWAELGRAIERLGQTGRQPEAELVAAGEAAMRGDSAAAAARLGQLLNRWPATGVGWLIPIEPCFRPLGTRPDFRAVTARLAELAS
jgi:DNA-binding winged helix-turn-helix (wHTH) protein